MVCTRADRGTNTGGLVQLPVHAAVEGPKICFRLLEIDDIRGMVHEQFMALMSSAMDNRYTNTYTQSLQARLVKDGRGGLVALQTVFFFSPQFELISMDPTREVSSRDIYLLYTYINGTGLSLGLLPHISDTMGVVQTGNTAVPCRRDTYQSIMESCTN